MQLEAGEFEQALTTASEIQDKSRWKNTILLDIAVAQAEAGLFEQALATAREIPAISVRVHGLAEIAAAQVEAGLGERATTTFTEALATVGSAHDERTLVDVYQSIIRRLTATLEPD